MTPTYYAIQTPEGVNLFPSTEERRPGAVELTHAQYLDAISKLMGWHAMRIHNGALEVGWHERPSPETTYNWDTHQWEDSLMLARSAAKTRIENFRNKEILSPIEHQGVFLDADKNSHDNVDKKLKGLREKMARGIPVDPESLVWRAADNSYVNFDTEVHMEEWLSLLVVAMVDRGEKAYATSWALKAQVDGSTDISFINGICQEPVQG